jgi:hypothetical protein
MEIKMMMMMMIMMVMMNASQHLWQKQEVIPEH